MVFGIVLFVLICTSASSHHNGNVVWLKSPRVTHWGKFGPHEFCPKNSFVTGMRLKVDHTHVGDNTALNAIQLICTDMNGYDSMINSATGAYGSFGKTKYCLNGFATGFQLRSQPFQGLLGDDVGAVDFKLICSDISGDPSQIIADNSGFLPWGDWTKEKHCPSKRAVCGIATQVDSSSGLFFKRDQSTLNNVDIACCLLTRPIETCSKLTYNWETLIACPTETTCEINLITGIVEGEQLSKLRKIYDNRRNKIGSFDNYVMRSLQVKAKRNREKINNRSLKRILKQTNLNKNESTVSVNCKGRIQQLVAACDFIKFYTSESQCVPDQYADKVEGLYFQATSPSENIFWSYNCDFTGGDVGSVSAGNAADCGEKCLVNTDCTHFSYKNYNGGTCWMKGVLTLNTPVERYGEKIICGWVERP
ncbi:uncharacterized protein LOC119082266 isoform X2 [Bradysia coprophila]|uniref:uncharacterized protein LOC119082266 isoform X2 n=1 Tax=Bradysia coprophila TaxID=38358 RepID=UPI00187DCFC0|nr:uncharacterized protein LOC119082266 isoform X2 [Bradysia coprophila]